MSKRNIIRAWKDPEYRASLSASERAKLPANPAGSIELEARELREVAGGASDMYFGGGNALSPGRLTTSGEKCHPLNTLQDGCDVFAPIGR